MTKPVNPRIGVVLCQIGPLSRPMSRRIIGDQRNTPRVKRGPWPRWRSAAPHRSSDGHVTVGKLCVRQAESEFKSRHNVVLTRIEGPVWHKTKLWRTLSKCLQSVKAPALYRSQTIPHPGVIDGTTLGPGSSTESRIVTSFGQANSPGIIHPVKDINQRVISPLPREVDI